MKYFLTYWLPGIMILLGTEVQAQPYFDIAGLNYQYFSLPGKVNAPSENHYETYAFGLFLPKKLNNRSTLLLRLNGETVQSSVNPKLEEAVRVYGLSVAVGYQWLSATENWKTVFMAIPKLAGNCDNGSRAGQFQYGATFLEQFRINKQLQIKAGLYYNKEVFGDFWVPLLGVDWKASPRWQFFGVLPTSYKVEYALQKKKWYCGLHFKALTRSFPLSGSSGENYIRFDEVVMKTYLEYYFLQNMVCYTEIGRSLGNPPLIFQSGSGKALNPDAPFQAQGRYTFFSVSLAYRIRTD